MQLIILISFFVRMHFFDERFAAAFKSNFFFFKEIIIRVFRSKNPREILEKSPKFNKFNNVIAVSLGNWNDTINQLNFELLLN